jgi:DNA-binding GntR family transcriptional regulator
VQTVGFTKEGRAVEYSVARYRGDRTSFSIELQV